MLYAGKYCVMDCDHTGSWKFPWMFVMVKLPWSMVFPVVTMAVADRALMQNFMKMIILQRVGLLQNSLLLSYMIPSEIKAK